MKLIIVAKEILAAYGGTRVNGRVASNRTIAARGESICASLRQLYALGYKLEDPKSIGERHLKALCVYWFSTGKAPKTIQINLSNLRLLCTWMGKKGLVRSINYYLPDVPKDKLRVKTIAENSKGWTSNHIDVRQKIEEADQLDWRFGLMLRVQLAFGLRRMEVLQMQPWKCDEGTTFYAYKTKGGRPRLIYIDTVIQRQVMDLVKSKIGKRDYLGWSHKTNGSAATLAYSERRYNYLMNRLGMTKAIAQVTGHGLRAQFAENSALLKDLIPPTLGGTRGQMSREDSDVVRQKISESLGHSRTCVTGAYYGSFGREEKLDAPGRARETIAKCFKEIDIEPTVMIRESRIEQCMQLQSELSKIGVYDDPRKVEALWVHHSRRHAADWITPHARSNLAALEEAAMSMQRGHAQGSVNVW